MSGKSPDFRRPLSRLRRSSSIWKPAVQSERRRHSELAAVLLELRRRAPHAEPAVCTTRSAPLPGTNMDPASLRFTGIDPYHPSRKAVRSGSAPGCSSGQLRKAVKHGGLQPRDRRSRTTPHSTISSSCRARIATTSSAIRSTRFHSSTPASLAAVAYGQTVLSQACGRAGIAYDSNEAHSARYDAEVTAALFCAIVEPLAGYGGWPPRE